MKLSIKDMLSIAIILSTVFCASLAKSDNALSDPSQPLNQLPMPLRMVHCEGGSMVPVGYGNLAILVRMERIVNKRPLPSDIDQICNDSFLKNSNIGDKVVPDSPIGKCLTQLGLAPDWSQASCSIVAPENH